MAKSNLSRNNLEGAASTQSPVSGGSPRPLPDSSTPRLPLVYIAGPYTNPDPVENTHKAIRAGLALYDLGVAVPFIPHLTLLAHMVDPRPVDYWYELDLAQLDHCSAVWRLVGASTGADKEVAYAEEKGIPVFHHYADLLEWLR